MPERHEIQVTDEIAVVAVHHPAPGEDWLVFCHGLHSDKSGSYEGRAERAVEAGYNAVRFDFRGCGESDGDFAEGTLSGRIADLEAVLAHFDPPAVVLFGSSFGGAVAFHAAVDDDRVDAVATRAPVTDTAVFDRPADATDAAEDALGARFLADLENYEFGTVTGALDVPVAIFHGAADESVPIDYSHRAVRDFSTDVLFQTYADEGHLFSRAAEARLRELLFAWLA